MQATTTAATTTAVSHSHSAPDGVPSSAPEDRFESLHTSFRHSISLTILSIHAQVRRLQYRCQFVFCCQHLLVLPLSARRLPKFSSSTLWAVKQASCFCRRLSPERKSSHSLAFNGPSNERGSSGFSIPELGEWRECNVEGGVYMYSTFLHNHRNPWLPPHLLARAPLQTKIPTFIPERKEGLILFAYSSWKEKSPWVLIPLWLTLWYAPKKVEHKIFGRSLFHLHPTVLHNTV